MTSGTLPASLPLFEPEKDCTLPFLTLLPILATDSTDFSQALSLYRLVLSVLYQHKNRFSSFRPNSPVTFYLFILTLYALGVTGSHNKPTKVSTDVVENHLAKKVAPGKIESILTDCGTESTPWHEEARATHEVEKTCNRLGIKHTTTKGKHPWTNGYGERLNKTLLDEFYAVAFRKK
jgi:hypothetical protein